MQELLSQFEMNSYTVVTAMTTKKNAEIDAPNILRVLHSADRLPRILRELYCLAQIPLIVFRMSNKIKQKNVKVIMGVYPDRTMLLVAQLVAKRAKIPLIGYFHDTLLECCRKGLEYARTKQLQEAIFREASALLVVSDGMADFYREKYGLPCVVLRHIYKESIPQELPFSESVARQAFWGGAVYAINDVALARVSHALSEERVPLFITSKKTVQYYECMGLKKEGMTVTYISGRNDYLKAIVSQGVLILALNWPNESTVAEEELSTIFPTKAVEYLASGRPILVHCPSHYYLAKFFEAHKCGIVVAERDQQALQLAVRFLLADSQEVTAMRRNALAAAGYFDATTITNTLRAVVNEVARVSWSEKLEWTVGVPFLGAE
jgi:hypothetical protein